MSAASATGNQEAFICFKVGFSSEAVPVLYFSVASPVPNHKNVRCSFDFCLQGPLVDHRVFPLVRWQMLSSNRSGFFLPHKGAVKDSEKWLAKCLKHIPHLTTLNRQQVPWLFDPARFRLALLKAKFIRSKLLIVLTVNSLFNT